jgi:hypothetical protein
MDPHWMESDLQPCRLSPRKNVASIGNKILSGDVLTIPTEPSRHWRLLFAGHRVIDPQASAACAPAVLPSSVNRTPSLKKPPSLKFIIMIILVSHFRSRNRYYGRRDPLR